MRSMLLVVLGLCAAAVVLAQSRSQAQQFQEAIRWMEDKGNYPAAIRLFEESAKGPDRSLAARSLLYVGICYEKLGQDGAQKAYRRLIRQFADQLGLVAQARTRLFALATPSKHARSPAMSVRRVLASRAVQSSSGISDDGQYLSYIDDNTGDLALLALSTGKSRSLTSVDYSTGDTAGYSTISPNSKQVAYTWCSKKGFCDLRIIGVDGSNPRVLYGNEETAYITPTEWSQNGRQILAHFFKKDESSQIVLVSVANGSVQVLKSFQHQTAANARLSPDGSYVAYDRPQQEGAEQHDIFLLATDGNGEVPLVEHPADDSVLGWSPDGKEILFASDRTGGLGAWMIQVADGKPQKTPEPVKQNIGRLWPMRLSRTGSFYYRSQSGGQDVYIATLNPVTGQLINQPTPADPRSVGSSSWPEWSPDGRYLAWVSSLSLPGRPEKQSLVILSMESGDQRVLFPRLGSYVRPRWSPDNRSLLVHGRDDTDRGGLYIIDATTEAVTPILYSTPEQDFPRQAAWFPDGKALFYKHSISPIFLRAVQTGVEKEVFPDGIEFAASPDGRWLAVGADDGPDKQESVLKVVDVASGEARELLRLAGPGVFNSSLAWTAEGGHVLFVKVSDDSQAQKSELWRIAREGGQPQRLGLAMKGLSLPRAHPDGRRVAFRAGAGIATSEIWVMENFLPAAKVQ